jgi:aquaporin Z
LCTAYPLNVTKTCRPIIPPAPFAALGVGSYIALAGLWGAPVSGASMNPFRSIDPALVMQDWNAWWAYLAGPLAGAAVAVVIAQALRGKGSGEYSSAAAHGTLGIRCSSDPPAAAPLGREFDALHPG